jgi:hypothetical protein
MPTYEIVGPDGGTYHIDADTEEAALSAFHPEANKYQQAASDLYAKQKKFGLTGGMSEGLASRVLQGGTLGFGDEILAGLETPIEMARRGVGPSEGYKYAKAFQDVKRDEARRNTGAFGTAAEIGGSFLPSGVVAKGVQRFFGAPAAAGTALTTGGSATNLPAVAGQVLPKAQKLNPFGQSVATGAITGGVQGAGEEGTDGIVPGMVAGAAGGAAGHALGSVLDRGAGLVNGAPRVAPAPSTDAIHDAAQNAYDAFTNAGGLFTQQGVNDLSSAIRTRLQNEGWAPELAPQVTALLRRLESYRQGGASGVGQMTPRELQTLRKIASNISKSADDQTSFYGGVLTDELDNFLSVANPAHFTGRPGGASQADLAYTLQGANKLWSQYKKSADIDLAKWKAENRAASTYSGGNENNAFRQNLKSLWEKRGREGFTPDENAAFQTAVRGGTAENVARGVGKLAASRGGLSAMAQLAAMLHSPHIAIPLEVTAEGAKYLGDRLTRRNLEEVSRVVRNGGVRRTAAPPAGKLQNFTRQMSPYLAGPAGAFAVRGLLDEP